MKKLEVYFGLIDARDSHIIGVMGDSTIDGVPDGIHNRRAVAKVAQEYMQKLYELQKEMENKLLSELIAPDKDTKVEEDINTYPYGYICFRDEFPFSKEASRLYYT